MRLHPRPDSRSSFHGSPSMAATVERQLEGYIAAIDEGLPVAEPRSNESALVTAVLLRELTGWAVSAVKARLDRWRRPHDGHPFDERLTFGRYLYDQGYIEG